MSVLVEGSERLSGGVYCNVIVQDSNNLVEVLENEVLTRIARPRGA